MGEMALESPEKFIRTLLERHFWVMTQSRGAGVFALRFPDKKLRISSKSFPYYLKWLLLGHEVLPKPFVAAFTIVDS
jgi:hypothetical protein